jgi:uncharacterized membrane protein
MGKNKLIYRMSIDAMLIAIYFVLAKFTIPIGNIRITFATIAIIIPALLFSIPDTLVIALLGEFIIQWTGIYGLTITTPLWLVPPAIRGLIISTIAYVYKKGEDRLENHKVVYSITVISAAIITTVLNTLVMFLDAIIIGYPFEFFVVETIIRAAVGIGTSIVIGVICIPIVYALNKALKLPS